MKRSIENPAGSSRAMRWMEVTPTGCRSSSLPLAERIAELKVQLLQVGFLVRWNLHEKAFARVLGSLWIVLDPLLIALLYFFLLAIVFGQRGFDTSVFVLIVSVTFWRLHANLLLGAPGVLVARAAILQQTNFPLSIILFEYLGTEIATFGINVAITLVILLVAGYVPTWYWLLVPVVVAVQLTFTICLVLPLAIAGTVVRDIAPFLNFFVAVWFYLSPVIYDVSRIPERFRGLMLLNPFWHIAAAYRSLLFEGTVPSLTPLVIIFVLSSIGIIVGMRVLQRARFYFYKYL